jgi:protein associated with RNAse G/E
VNIATPAVWHDGTLRFVDLDLDVIWSADSGEILLDDEDEFELHQVRFGYPSDLIEQVWRSADEVREMMARRAYPFDGSLFTWRPDGSPK